MIILNFSFYSQINTFYKYHELLHVYAGLEDSIGVLYFQIFNKCYTNQSVSPVFQAAITFHESSHRLITCSYLLHVVTIGCFLTTKSAFFWGCFENIFLHFIIKTSLAHLKLLFYMFLDSSLRLFIFVCRFIVLGNLLWSFLALNHF